MGEDTIDLTHATVLSLKPGDVLVFRHPGLLSQQAVTLFRESVRCIVPSNVQILVLEEGMRVDVLRPEQETKWP